MRRGGYVDERGLLCHASPFLSHQGKGILPPSNEASHAKDVSVNHGFLEESTTPLYVATTAVWRCSMARSSLRHVRAATPSARWTEPKQTTARDAMIGNSAYGNSV